MTKIVHLTSVHPAVDARIFHKECRTLAAAGYDVALVAPHRYDETVNDIRIKAVPFPVDRKRRFLQTVWQVYRAGLREDASIYHIHDPELIPIGILLKLSGRSVVYDVHEDFPKDVLKKQYILPMARPGLAQLVESAESLAAAVFDGIVTATPVIGRRFPPKKTVVVQNFAMMDEWISTNAIPYSKRGPIMVYVGSITEVRGIRETMTALSLLPAKLEPRLALAGNFSPSTLEDECRRSPGWERVDFAGWRSRTELAQILGSARLGLVLLHPTPTYLESQPTKLYEYMSAGLPVIASSFPLWRDLIERNGCGIVVDPLDPNAIARAIEWMLEHPSEAEAMGARGRATVEKYFTWDAEASKLLGLYDNVLVGRKEQRG